MKRTIMERFMSKAHKTTLTLCGLQQSAHATGCIKGHIG